MKENKKCTKVGYYTTGLFCVRAWPTDNTRPDISHCIFWFTHLPIADTIYLKIGIVLANNVLCRC